jgi:hypothetical protein
MKLSVKQQKFTACLGKLILYACSKNYGLTQGDGYRDKRIFGEFGEKKAYSAAKSVHKIRLAHDFNLYIENKWISDGGHPAWLDLGEYWEGLDEDARWGGRFDDSNHFSFQHWGCK